MDTGVRSAGRLLNVLCTFSLRPVSTGYPMRRRSVRAYQRGRNVSFWKTLHKYYIDDAKSESVMERIPIQQQLQVKQLVVGLSQMRLN